METENTKLRVPDLCSAPYCPAFGITCKCSMNGIYFILLKYHKRTSLASVATALVRPYQQTSLFEVASNKFICSNDADIGSNVMMLVLNLISGALLVRSVHCGLSQYYV